MNAALALLPSVSIEAKLFTLLKPLKQSISTRASVMIF